MSMYSKNSVLMSKLVLVGSVICVSALAEANNLVKNPDFEASREHWDYSGEIAMSNVSFNGFYSGKISGASGRWSQVINLQPHTNYRLSAKVKGFGMLGALVGSNTISTHGGASDWHGLSTEFNSGAASEATIFGGYYNGQVRFDAFNLEQTGSIEPGENCVNPITLGIANASDDGSHDGHAPAATIDNNLSNESRWSSSGNGKWIQYDLGVSALVTDVKLAWYQGDSRVAYFDIEVSSDNHAWIPVVTGHQSTGNSNNFETVDIPDTSARYVRIVSYGNSVNYWNSLLETRVNGCVEDAIPPTAELTNPTLDPTKPPSGNFDLLDWTLSVPVDNDGNGTADIITEQQLAAGYKHSKYFYTSSDGGMVFMAPVQGPKTSSNTKFTRSELREMLRRGNTNISTKGVTKNNWVFSSAPASDKSNAGGVDGELRATLAVNHVIKTGNSSEVGRVVIGQIHATDDEPLRIYYRKLPGNSKGSIYLAHEPVDSSDQWFNMIGSKSSVAPNPVDGIALNEKFSFRIKVSGNTSVVTIMRPGKPDVSRTINMSNSNYDEGNQYMYFKVGAYNQNYTGDANDYSKVTFYEVVNSHAGYSQ